MSFRLPRGPKLVTLFHDSNSSSSKRVLNILQSRSKPASEITKDQETRSSNGDEPSRVKQYLKEAATGNVDQDPIFEIEIVERSKATMDQWKVIASYLEKTNIELKQSRIEALKDENGPIVVDWDDGLAVQNEEEVKELIDKLIDGKGGLKAGKAGGNGCVIV